MELTHKDYAVAFVTRNRAKDLDVCIRSILKQTKKPDQFIIVDNASSDNTKNVSYKHNKHYAYLI